MLVKVCGMREPENIRAVAEAGADWIGFIFYPKSPRYVAAVPDGVPDGVRRIGVFVAPDYEEIVARRTAFGLHGIQLHGSATPELCQRLRADGLTVVRALPADNALPEATRAYQDSIDVFLFDTPTSRHGGSGRTFDWTLLTAYDGRVPFLLSGGLRPDSLPALCRFDHPQWLGIDLNSGFETRPGLKDATTLKTFITHFRQQHHEPHHPTL